ncbi:MAG: LysM peptidoglycan-binding domain-containing protein [Gemmatimonadetes bacterium]|nr:LysM peptidoglycan-binding domain-containing protein [Gemmatimonadota bacterium]
MPSESTVMIVPSRLRLAVFVGAALAAWGWSVPAAAQSLRGSVASLDRQNRQARVHDFTYIDTPSQVRRFVDSGYLVPVRSNRDFELHAVSFPYARPEAELFIRRLSAQYHAACGEKLVVTSLTRPQNRQPRNASDRSVHPTGMAIDLRYSRDRTCRSWLEGVLLSLERTGVLEATRERYPAHYHIALYPRPYASYVDRLASADSRPARRAQRVAEAAPTIQRYQVRRGDSLWTIARKHGVSISDLRASNDLNSSRIYAGQVLRVPVRAER